MLKSNSFTKQKHLERESRAENWGVAVSIDTPVKVTQRLNYRQKLSQFKATGSSVTAQRSHGNLNN
jgi:hypothetical protein